MASTGQDPSRIRGRSRHPVGTRCSERKGIQEKIADSEEEANERNANSQAQENVTTGWTLSSSLHLQGKLHNQWHWPNHDLGSDWHQLPSSSPRLTGGGVRQLWSALPRQHAYKALYNPCCTPTSHSIYSPRVLSYPFALVLAVLSRKFFPFHSPSPLPG